VVWDFDLDADAMPRSVEVRRALVRSRVQLSYAQVQSDLDADTADDVLRVIRSVGRLREGREAERGGVALPIPEQVVANVGHDWSLTFRAPLPIEGWNAQISLMTGMAAADFMLAHGVGVLRTMPPPSTADLQRVRRTAEALGLSWPSSGTYPDLIRSADASRPAHLAFLSLATTLLRCAGYTVFDGEEPALRTHSAVAAPYAHVTAPLRRLVDRFGTEIALAACAGADVPDWVTAALAALPDQMAGAGRTARSLERESLNLVEAVLRQDRVGESFEAAVVDSDGRGGFSIVIQDPAVRARAKGDLSVGSHAEVSLKAADPATRRVQFEAATG
jgi:exoribonuclease R